MSVHHDKPENHFDKPNYTEKYIFSPVLSDKDARMNLVGVDTDG